MIGGSNSNKELPQQQSHPPADNARQQDVDVVDQRRPKSFLSAIHHQAECASRLKDERGRSKYSVWDGSDGEAPCKSFFTCWCCMLLLAAMHEAPHGDILPAVCIAEPQRIVFCMCSHSRFSCCCSLQFS